MCRTRREELDDLRPHGTKGIVGAYCPMCGTEWEAPVRWHKEKRKWLVVQRRSGYCMACLREWAVLVVGRKRGRYGSNYRDWFTRISERARNGNR